MTFDWTLKLGDMAIVCATFLGPIAAVQAQKWIERGRERRNRRVTIFRVLMTTRATTLSPAHVEALNVVPIEFYGKEAAFVDVVDAWKTYIDYLYRDNVEPKAWAEKRVELLNEMLAKMALALGYRFNSVEIKRELYSPRGHAAIEGDQEIIRQGFAKLFKGELSLPMDVKSFPSDPEFIQGQIEIQRRLLKCLDESGNLKVALGSNYPTSGAGAGIVTREADE